MKYKMISYKKILKPTTNIAEDDIIIMLRRICKKACTHLQLELKIFDRFPLGHEDMKNTAGVCHAHEKEIYINLYSPLTGAFLPLEDLIDTTLHEVVHLMYPDEAHTKRFWATLDDLKEWYFQERARND